jgi:hypothetical protein
MDKTIKGTGNQFAQCCHRSQMSLVSISSMLNCKRLKNASMPETHPTHLRATFFVMLTAPNRIADQFAANGYITVMPDLFNGDPVPLNRPQGFELPKWLQNHGTERIDPIISAALKDMRGRLGCKHIGAVGYCFGGKYVCRFLKNGQLDAGYTAHPSFVQPDELEGIEGPLSIAAAGM